MNSYYIIFDSKARKLIKVNRDVMKEALKSFQISAEILAGRSKAMLLATEDAAKPPTGCILTTNSIRLQTEYKQNTREQERQR